ncbi:ornithine uptake porin CarO [Acinetobacter johnsonii]|uniref:ornithine uptake porin CarO n=1 Tax=Acinetobacter johnsonii TaxID=40214 RepID=UPI0019194896|nr:ornithine uptake porin CarO [Acinetobacter johnsonii]QQT57083.1 ornithine uptake porin CarO [Acinetobacter johnsonii]
MKSLRLVAIAAAMSAVAGTAFADDAVVKDGYAFDQNKLIPTGVRAEVGTTGYGGALLWTANPYVGLALGYNGGDISWSDDLKINGSKYDLDMDNKLAYLNAEIRPWGASTNRWAQGVYVAAGVGYVDNEYGLNRNVSAGRNFTVNHTDFQAGQNGVRIDGQMDYDNQFAPYVGLGWAPKINQNWGVFGEVGAYYTGNPNANLQRVSGSAVSTVGADLDDELAKETNKLINDDKYEWMPVAKLGVSYHW